MAHHQAEGTTGEAAIGDQRHGIQKSLAHDGGGGAEHFTHAGAANGPLMAHHHHIARVDLLVEDGGQAGFLALEHARRAGDHGVFHTADLRHGALFSQVALEDRQVAFGIERIAEGADYVLPSGWNRGHIGEHLLEGLAFDGFALAVEQAGIQQEFHHLGDATGLVEIHGHVAATGLEVADHGHPLADLFEVVN